MNRRLYVLAMSGLFALAVAILLKHSQPMMMPAAMPIMPSSTATGAANFPTGLKITIIPETPVQTTTSTAPMSRAMDSPKVATTTVHPLQTTTKRPVTTTNVVPLPQGDVRPPASVGKVLRSTIPATPPPTQSSSSPSSSTAETSTTRATMQEDIPSGATPPPTGDIKDRVGTPSVP